MANRLVAPAWVAASALALGGCMAETDRTREIRAPAATVAGAAVNCVQTTRIRNTHAHDDYTIDFEMLGGEIYRNTLPIRCSGLGFEQRFSYATSTAQLCSADTITVLYSDGRAGATCGLGQFVPIRYAAPAG